jgi:hypothetical protein
MKLLHVHEIRSCGIIGMNTLLVMAVNTFYADHFFYFKNHFYTVTKLNLQDVNSHNNDTNVLIPRDAIPRYLVSSNRRFLKARILNRVGQAVQID